MTNRQYYINYAITFLAFIVCVYVYAIFSNEGFVALFFGIFTVLGALGMIGALSEQSHRRLLASAGDGIKPKDDKISAVAGVIEPQGEPLRSPFTHKPCIAYDYRIYHIDEQGQSSKGIDDFVGWAFTPSAIRTSFGLVKLRGIPDIKDFVVAQPLNYGPANEYLRSTQFEKASLKKIRRLRENLNALMHNTTGELRQDIRFSDAEEASGRVLNERVVATGTRVTALGRYSEEHESLVNSSRCRLRLLPGDVGRADVEMMKSIRTRMVVSLIMLGFSALILFLNPATRVIPGVMVEYVRRGIMGLLNAG